MARLRTRRVLFIAAVLCCIAAMALRQHLQGFAPRLITVCTNPSAMTVDTRTHHAFVLSEGAVTKNGQFLGAGWLATVDSLGGRVLATVHVGMRPIAIAVDAPAHHAFVVNAGDNVYSNNNSNGSLSMIDTRSGSVLSTTALPGVPTSIGIDARLHHAFVTSSDGSVSVINASNNTLLATIPVGGTPDSVAVDALHGRVFVPNTSDGDISILDARTGFVLDTVSVQGDGMALDQRSERAIIVDQASNRVAILDSVSGRVLRSVVVGMHPSAIAVDERTGHAFVLTANAKESVETLDIATGRLLQSAIIGGQSPVQPTSAWIAVDARLGRVFVINEGGGNVHILDSKTGTVVGAYNVGGTPNAMTVDEAAGRVFVSNGTYIPSEPPVPAWWRQVQRLLPWFNQQTPATCSHASLNILNASSNG